MRTTLAPPARPTVGGRDSRLILREVLNKEEYPKIKINLKIYSKVLMNSLSTRVILCSKKVISSKTDRAAMLHEVLDYVEFLRLQEVHHHQLRQFKQCASGLVPWNNCWDAYVLLSTKLAYAQMGMCTSSWARNAAKKLSAATA